MLNLLQKEKLAGNLRNKNKKATQTPARKQEKGKGQDLPPGETSPAPTIPTFSKMPHTGGGETAKREYGRARSTENEKKGSGGPRNSIFASVGTPKFQMREVNRGKHPSLSTLKLKYKE